MVVRPTIARSILRIHRRSQFSASRFISDSSNYTACRWQFQSRRSLILESVSESVKLRKLSDSDSGIPVLDLDRPKVKNAIGKDMLTGLSVAWRW
ncbi:putative enoyl-CoA hydratase 2, mitochondrial [Drosera capensis]